MPTFEVAKAEHKKTFTGKSGGDFDVWSVSLKDTDGMFTTAEIVQKQGSPAPAGRVEGELDTSGPFAAKFKRAQRNGFGGGGSRSDDPATRRSIHRQTAQKNALHLLEIAVAMGKVTKDQPKITTELLLPWTDWFYADIEKAANDG